MSYSKKSSAGGATLYSPPQSTMISRSSANTVHQTPSTDNSSGQLPVVIPAYQQRPDYTPQDCINVSLATFLVRTITVRAASLTIAQQDIRKICKETQTRVQALSQAIGRQPGMPGSLTDLLNNDLRVVAQQFASTAYHCRMIEKKLEERTRANFQERTALHASQEVELNSFRAKLQSSQDRVRKLEQDLRDIETNYTTAEKRRKVELEKKAEKISNQKRRIKEQQDQIDVSSGPFLRSRCSNETDFFFLHPEPQEKGSRWKERQGLQAVQQGLR